MAAQADLRRALMLHLVTTRQLHLHQVKVGPTLRWCLLTETKRSGICRTPKCVVIPLKRPS